MRALIRGWKADGESAAIDLRRIAAFFPSPLVTWGVPISYFVTAMLAAYLAKRTGNIVPIWLPSSILLVTFIRLPMPKWPVMFISGMIADLSMRFAMGWSFVENAGSAFADVLEPLAIALALRRFTDCRNWFFSIRWMFLFPLFTLVGASLAAAFGTVWFQITLDNQGDFLPDWALWASGDIVTIFIFTPFLLCWTEPALRSRLPRWRLLEAMLLTCAVAGVSYVVFSDRFPLPFLIFPLLALITLRARLPGATAGVVTAAAIAFWYTVNGSGPIASLPATDLVSRIFVMQLYFLTAVLATIPLALMLTHREVIADRLIRQDAISSAALNNMVQGLCMFDDRHRLITCNRRYADLYDLPEELLVPGTPLKAILEQQVAAGNYWGDAGEYVANGLAEADIMSPHKEAELPDGRIIEIHTRLLADGAWVATHEDVTDRRRAGYRIAHLASHDPLTDLPNRAFFGEQLERSIALAERGHGFALHSFDLDRFKAVNDTFGHAAGDELLRQVGDRLRQITRDGDFVARLGGDEFAILQFPLEGPNEAAMLAARLVEELSKPYRVMGHDLSIGASAGIALAPRDTLNSADLLQKSDLALYRAKTNGRGTHCFFESGMDTALNARRVLETELKAAVQKGEFELYYQPILNLETGSISSLEALIRWRHPIRGMIDSGEFIALAEESGLIVPIGEWVIRQACREATGWPKGVKVAVNLSPVQFKKGNLVALVTKALEGAGLAPERLELEVTESLLLQDPVDILSVLKEIRALGVSIAMDAFGNGYSSLSYICKFPFDRIKIDRSFVHDVTAKQDCLAVIHATTQLSERLGMRTTAEGVETAEQFAILEREGCTELQGYYISRPLAAHKVQEALARHPQSPLRLLERKVA